VEIEGPNNERQLKRALVEQRAFMLRVARSLCDGHMAEDVVQETTLRALQHPPRHMGFLRSWLRKAVANTSLELMRAEARRTRREERVARVEGHEPTGPETSSLYERIQQALDSLREPYRTVLALRFMDGLAPEAIAARTGTSLEAVRTQLKRGRKQLRDELDRRFGDRREWTLALLPWTRRARWAPLGALIPLAAVGTVAIILTLLVHPTPVPEAAALEPDRGRPQTPDVVRFEGTPNAARTTATSEGVPLGRSTVVVEGRCVDTAGRPVADADVYILPADERAVHQPFERFAAARTRTGADGDFRIELLSLPAYVVAQASPDWITTEVAEVYASPTESGQVELVLGPAATVRGTAVDGTGNPVASAAVELLRRTAYPGTEVRQQGTSVLYHRDLPIRGTAHADGRFELVRPAYDVRQLHARQAGLPDGWVIPLAGRDAVVRLADVYELELTALFQGRPAPSVQVELFAPGYDEPWVGTTGLDGSLRIDRLPGASSWVARLSGEGFAPQVTLPRGIMPGSVRMRRWRARTGSLLSPDGMGVASAIVKAVDLRVVQRTVAAGFDPTIALSMCTLATTTSDELGRFELPGHSGDLAVFVAPPAGLASTMVMILHTEDEIRISLAGEGETTRFKGRVVGSDGRPLTAFRVRALYLDDMSPRPGPWQEREHVDGRFLWEEPAGQAFLLEVESPGRVRRVSQGSLRAADTTNEIVLHRARDVELRFVDALGTPLSEAEVLCTTQHGKPVLLPLGPEREQSRFLLDRNGMARLAGTPVGTWRFWLIVPGFHDPFTLDVDLAEAGDGPLELTLPAVFSGARRTLRLELLRDGTQPLTFFVRAQDTEGHRILDDRLRWDSNGLKAVPPRTAKAIIREAGHLERRVRSQGWTSAPHKPAYDTPDLGCASLALRVPADEAVSIEILTATHRRTYTVGASVPGPIAVRLPAAGGRVEDPEWSLR
jgi:RNA polymerase sigma-70 factor (ECF subfamily)